MPGCEVIVFALNEERSIERVLRSVLDEPWNAGIELERIIVCTAASTDRTDDLVTRLMEQDARIELQRHPTRRGKVHDVNDAVAVSRSERLLLMDADVEISRGCLTRLLAELDDGAVGMAVPHRGALNQDAGWLGFTAHLMAGVHNALELPKAGQVLAIRRSLAAVDTTLGVDDSYQEYRCLAARQVIRRIDEAIVYSMGPRTLSDFLLQRRRNVALHLALRRRHGYSVATLRTGPVVRAVLRTQRLHRPHLLVLAATLELVARVLGTWDAYVKRESYVVWRAAQTTRA
ncbi:MAG TPA: glycosyltransferase [Solirubrobacteraceae bacterium]